MEIHHTLTSSIIICIHVPHFIQDAQPASKSIKWYFDIHGSVHQYVLTKMTNKMQLCRIIYCSLTALHVLSDIFVQHQKHHNCIYSFWYYSRMWLLAGAWISFNSFQLLFLLNIRSITTVFTASGIIHVCGCRLESWISWNEFQLIHGSSRQPHT